VSARRVAGAAATLLAAWLAAARPANAKLVEVYGNARLGGVGGKGLSTLEMRSTDFFEATNGLGLGLEAGIELLFIDVFANFTQLVGASGLTGTLTQLLAGIDLDVALDGGVLTTVAGVKKDTPARTFARLGVAAGLAAGTPAPVDPPLNDAQISDKGVVAQATFAVDYKLNRLLSVGFELNGGYHYFFAGAGAAANDTTNHSKGLHFMGFVNLGFRLAPK